MANKMFIGGEGGGAASANAEILFTLAEKIARVPTSTISTTGFPGEFYRDAYLRCISRPCARKQSNMSAVRRVHSYNRKITSHIKTKEFYVERPEAGNLCGIVRGIHSRAKCIHLAIPPSIMREGGRGKKKRIRGEQDICAN